MATVSHVAPTSQSQTRVVSPATPDRVAARLGSVDAYRGLVMFLMMAEVLRLAAVSRANPDSSFWRFLAFHQTHAEWAGCSLHDLIQPSFSLLVGVALPFSLASRLARGQSLARASWHAAWRAVVLIVLGIFLRSIGKSETYYTFEDTLTQIGLGYLPLFFLALAPPRWWWAALAMILVGYWATFALYPLPGSDFVASAVGVDPKWAQQFDFTGFAAHWNKNTNAAWAFDTWFLNSFPRSKPFAFNGGGYATLSFIPTLGTMILGLIAGDWLRNATGQRGTSGSTTKSVQAPSTRTASAVSEKWLVCLRMVVAGGLLLAIGLVLHYTGICPSVKRIWTPSWTLVSGGACFLILAGFYAVIDGLGFRAWSFPLRVIGMNSIAAYMMAHLFDDFIVRSFKTHLGKDFFQFPVGTGLEPFFTGIAVLVVYWLILYWMYRQKFFVKI